jgi:hypothetical protein
MESNGRRIRYRINGHNTMTNKYYSIGTTTPIANINAALLDKYGAYDAGSNPDGVLVHALSTTDIIFSCARLSNKVIKVNLSASNIRHYYGDAYVSGTTITNEVAFTGTSTTGTNSAAHLVLGDYTYLMQILLSTQLSKLAIIGKMTNSDYGVLGLNGSSSVTYNSSCIGKNTSTDAIMRPSTWGNPFTGADGKLYRQIPAMYAHGSIGVQVNSDGSFAFFQDVFNASHNNAASAIVLGSTFLLTTGNMYMDSASLHLRTCLLMEFEAVT